MNKRYRATYDLRLRTSREDRPGVQDFYAGDLREAEEDFADFAKAILGAGRSADVRSVSITQVFEYEVTYRAHSPAGPVSETEKIWSPSSAKARELIRESVGDQYDAIRVDIIKVRLIGK